VKSFHERARLNNSTEEDKLLKVRLIQKAEDFNASCQHDNYVADNSLRTELIKQLRDRLTDIVEALELQGVQTICTTFEIGGIETCHDSIVGIDCRNLPSAFPSNDTMLKIRCLDTAARIRLCPKEFDSQYFSFKKAFLHQMLVEKYKAKFRVSKVESTIPWSQVGLINWPVGVDVSNLSRPEIDDAIMAVEKAKFDYRFNIPASNVAAEVKEMSNLLEDNVSRLGYDEESNGAQSDSNVAAVKDDLLGDDNDGVDDENPIVLSSSLASDVQPPKGLILKYEFFRRSSSYITIIENDLNCLKLWSRGCNTTDLWLNDNIINFYTR
jgi:hypothetical protein